MMYGRTRALSVSAIIGLLALLSCTFTVSAGPTTDIVDGVNNALFGGANEFAAQAILTAIVMMSAGLLLAMLHLDYIATFVVLFCILGGLTAMGWADPTIILVCGLFVVAMFTKRIVEYISGMGGQTSDDS